MGNKQSNTNENNFIEEIKDINIDDLDLSKIDALQLKAIKQMAERLKVLEKEKQTKLTYTIPKVDLCNMSLF